MSKNHETVFVPQVCDAPDNMPNAPVAETVVASEPPVMCSGVVANCRRLNIRSTPTKAGEIVAVVAAGTKLIIDEKKSTKAWFRVWTADGVDGFCMKDFVELNK